jgi:uncharacterized Zn-binding protein involved in type VI secretion
MGDFNRFFICDGDVTTAGGVVTATGTHMPIYGRAVALEGDSVQCPSCKSTGHIQCVPPMRPVTGHANKQCSVEGDLCICQCTSPPRLIASQRQASMGFSASEIASTSGAATWLAHAGASLAGFGYTFDRVVVLKNRSGGPLKNLPYKITLETGQVFEGVTDGAGQTEKVSSTQAHTAKIEAPYYGNTNHTAHAPHGSDACGC